MPSLSGSVAPSQQACKHAPGIVFWILLTLPTPVCSQTATTGALMGEVVDPSGRAIPQATIKAHNPEITINRSTVGDEQGHFVLPLLPPGNYRVTVAKAGFSPAQSISVQIPVTESVRVIIPMTVKGKTEILEVHATVSPLQSDSVALGRVVDGQTIQALPLAARNFTQIVDMSPGVSTGVNNAAELGPGGSGLAQIDAGNDGIFVHGSRSYDNSYEFDGIPVTDLQASNIASGGVPVPSPDAIEEFKVQTGLYSASFGEHAGASVSLVTRSGTNNLHGTAFEFLRNNILNANDFFRNRAGLQRPDLKQNQFGGTLGGPILPNRLYYFGSYQGTRQTNGMAADQARIACSATVLLPPLTGDRSPQALGALFAGMSGAFGGVAVKPDGSNINPVALEILNFKLPDGSYLIPTPQVITPTLSIASRGLSTISTPCYYNTDQVLANLDANLSQKSSLAVRFLWSDGTMNVMFPGNGLNGTGNISGFPSSIDNRFRVLSVSWVRPLRQQLLNQLRFGYTNTFGSTSARAPFQWSDLGVTAGTMNHTNELPSLGIVGSINMASAFPRSFNQKRFYFSDLLTFSHGIHLIDAGGSLSRIQDGVDIVNIGSLVDFLSWPDFLLGLSAEGNGSLFSNVYHSEDYFGLPDRKYQSLNGSLFVEDHLRVSGAFMLDLGLRYERLGQFTDNLGRNSSFDITQADPSAPPSGSVAGYIVAADYPNSIPAGVLRAGNNAGNFGTGQNGLAPRVGFAWQPRRRTAGFVVRGGYGLHFSQPTGQAFFQSVFGPPFSFGSFSTGLSNASATFKNPFQEPFPTPNFFPYFPPYSPTTNISGIAAVSSDFRPAIAQQFGLNAQAAVAKDWVLEVGYVGSRSTHLLRSDAPNQAVSASIANPVRGLTSNTVANIDQRVPIVGIQPEGLFLVESEGTSWYNGLEASLSKHLSHGLQMLASYTFSKTLDSDGSSINGVSAGNRFTLGNQDSPAQRWGRASFDRTHRFILSAVYSFPSPPSGILKALFGGWSGSGILTAQSGTALTIAYNNATNVFGIAEDRAQLAPGCNKSNLVRAGSVESKLNGYFNISCFTTPPVVGADGIGTAFGNSATGIVDGPAQLNVDLAVRRSVPISWPREGSSVQFLAEFFNALNHPQFADPNATFGSSSFSLITSTSVNPRLGQLAVKVIF